MIPDRFAPVLADIAPLAERFAAAGHRLYLVGGPVRDLLLGDGDFDGDLDFTTDARPPVIKSLLEGWVDALWTQGERFGTIGARRGAHTYEITTFRAEAYADDSRKPHVTFADDIEVDLSRRDFTINAMALEITSASPQLIDPFGGAVDLVAKVLRTPLAPEVSFSDDPLRMLRAARFVARFTMTPDPALVAAVAAMRGRLSIVSPERVREEFDKLLTLAHPAAGLWFLYDTGLGDEFFPELSAMRLEHDPIHRHKDVLSHSIAVVENVRPLSEQPLRPDGTPRPAFDFRRVRLAALYHDIGKPRTRGFQEGKGTTFHFHDVVGARMAKKRLTALRYSNDDIESVSKLVELHLRFHTFRLGWTDAAVRRYVRDAGELLNDLNVLTRCDCTTRNARKAAELAKRMDDLEARIDELAAAEELAAIRPELDGQQVMALLGIPPSRIVGEALDFLLEIRLDEGVLGEAAITERLRAWWAAREPGA